MSRKTRLIQYLLRTGMFERREEAALAIMRSRITVDGRIITNPNFEIREKSVVCLDGKQVFKVRDIYLAINKPEGVLCQKSRKNSDRTVFSIIKEKIPSMSEYELNSLFSVGRLDKDTTGLLIVTNDGRLNELMMKPDRKVEKTYIARLDRAISEDAIRKLRAGVFIPVEDEVGKKSEHKTEGCSAERIKSNEVRVTIHEGKKRQVRLMFETVGFRVVALKRVSIGRISLERLGIEKDGDMKEINKEQAYSF